MAYLSGLDAGVAGVPGEDSCARCHGGMIGPGATGSVTVLFPGAHTFTPGVKQHLVVTIADSAARRWGFQMTARLASGTSSQAGSFTAGADGFTQLVCTQTNFRSQAFGNACTTNGMPLQYIEHTQTGSRLGTANAATYEFDWTPPNSTTDNVILYVAALAANGDNSDHGDHTYATRYTLTPSTGSPSAPPAIAAGGVLNGASFQPGISAGSWVAIMGTNLAGTTRTWSAADIVNGSLPSTLEGVSVKINGRAASVEYVSPAQINVQAPADSSLGAVPVEVTYNGVVSAAGSATLQSVAPAFFLWSGKYAVATHADYTLAAPTGLFPGVTTVPAKPGETIILWGTGFGPTTPAVASGVVPPPSPVANMANPVTVTIGNLSATVLGAALAPGNAGLYQIAVQVPSAAPDGDLAVTAQINGVSSLLGVLLNVKR